MKDNRWLSTYEELHGQLVRRKTPYWADHERTQNVVCLETKVSVDNQQQSISWFLNSNKIVFPAIVHFLDIAECLLLQL